LKKEGLDKRYLHKIDKEKDGPRKKGAKT